MQTRQTLVDTYLTREKFEQFFEQMKQEKISEGEMSWVDAAPPIPGN